MKHAKYLITCSLLVAASVGLDSCSKSFLEKPLLGNLTEPVLANEKWVTALLVGAYAALDGQNVGVFVDSIHGIECSGIKGYRKHL